MTVVPVVEFFLLSEISDRLGFVTTVWLVILTGVVGASLAKREGISVLRKIQADSIRGIQPGKALTEGLLILIGGILLITPGVLTDIVGLIFIFPITRSLLASPIGTHLSARVHTMDGVDIGTPRPGPAATQVRDHFDHPVQ